MDKERHAALQNERYAYLRKRHLCYWCLKQDAYTLVGRCYCYECTQKDKKRKANYYKAHADGIRESREAAKEAGICTVCRKEKATPGFATCDECRKKQRLYMRARKFPENRAHKGLCTKCGKRVAEDGYRTCRECRERAREYMRAKKKRAMDA